MEGAYNVALAKVITPLSLDLGFLHAYLNSEHFQGELRLLSRSAQNGFNKGDLETFDFFLPPLAEQKVIADKLDTLLAQVENDGARLVNAVTRLVHDAGRQLDATIRGLPDLRRLVEDFTQRLDDRTERLGNAIWGAAIKAGLMKVEGQFE